MLATWILPAIALVVALVAVVLAGLAWAARSPGRATDDLDSLPTDVLGLRQEVAALRAESGGAFRHLAVVRYDAHGDMGGHLSWSFALLDDSGSGLVVTTIHGRSEARTYAKTIADYSSEAQLSPEEVEAIAAARP